MGKLGWLMCVYWLGCSSAYRFADKRATAEDSTNGADFSSPGSEFQEPTPIANAGADVEVVRGGTVVLDGRRSFHPGGETFTYRWSQVAGGAAVALGNPARALTTFSAPAKRGTLRFQLTVTSASGRHTSDEVSVFVVDTVPHSAPTLMLDRDREVSPGSTITVQAGVLGGETSAPVTWRQVAGLLASSSLSGAHGQTLTVTAPASGTFIFAAETTGFGLSSAPDFIVLEVGATHEAAAAKTLESTLPTLVVKPADVVSLNPYGTTPASAWKQLAGDPVEVDAKTGWLFTAPLTPQTLYFGITFDASLSSDFDAILPVEVSVPELTGLQPNAGADQLAHAGNVIRLDASGSTSATGVLYAWHQALGTQVELNAPTTMNPTFVAPNAPAELVFLLSLSSAGGMTQSDSTVVTVRPSSENFAPSGSVASTYAGGNGYTMRADVRDPESDTFGCTWTATGGTLSFSEGLTTELTLSAPSGPATAWAQCCDYADCATVSATVP